MDGAQVADTFGVMALLATVAVVLAALASASGAGRRERVRELVDEHGRTSAWLVAAVATAGSLWFSEGAGFTPCELCWYQRIAMYPLVPVLAVAVWRRDPGVRFYALPLALLGGAISTYHVVLERYPSLESGICELANPCSLIWVRRFGYLTIPAMALSAFAFIAVLLLTAGSWERSAAAGAPGSAAAAGEEPLVSSSKEA